MVPVIKDTLDFLLSHGMVSSQEPDEIRDESVADAHVPGDEFFRVKHERENLQLSSIRNSRKAMIPREIGTIHRSEYDVKDAKGDSQSGTSDEQNQCKVGEEPELKVSAQEPRLHDALESR